jgi:hypothetical protein
MNPMTDTPVSKDEELSQDSNVAEGCVEKPLIDQFKTTEKVRYACEYILRIKKKIDSLNALSSTELFTACQEAFKGQFHDSQKNTFSQYLSNTARDPESSIYCLGRTRGYYLSDTAKELVEKLVDPEHLATDVEETPVARRQIEVLLYPVLESWLIAQGYQAADVSAIRSLGKWGNPDLAGINAIDNFSSLSLEVVTIEAKKSLENWEQWIFEAVSHRRFANRSYFAFAHPEEAISKIPQDIRYYAELYNIGVLVLSLENKLFAQLINGELTTSLSSEDVDIVEIYSAPYNFVQPKYQIKFCNAVGINCVKKLYQWGNHPTEV